MSLFGRKSPPVAAKTAAAPETVAAPEAAVAPETVAPSSPAETAAADTAPSSASDALQAADVPAASTVVSTAARLAFLDKGTAAMTSTPPKPPAPSYLPGGARADQPARRLPDNMAGGLGGRRPEPAGLPPAPVPEAAAPAGEAQRRLIVGRDILLAGEIASCDVLVVEGTVEAKLRDGHSIEVTETGLFKGSVEIDDANIGGRFEGDLVVRNRLRVRSGGRIVGSIIYGELEVESGGQLVGTIRQYDPQPQAEVAAAPAEAAAPVAESAPAPASDAQQPVGDVQPAQVYMPPNQSYYGG